MRKKALPQKSYERPLPKVRTWLDESGEHVMYLDGNTTVSVHGYIHCGDALFVTCYDLRIERQELDSTDLEDAKTEALSVVRERIAYLAGLLEKVK